MSNTIQNLSTKINKLYKESQTVIPFIGSGFSRNISAQYPDWKMFLSVLSKDLCEKMDYNLNCDKKERCKAIDMNEVECSYLEDKFEDKLKATEFYIWKIGEKIEEGGTDNEKFDKGKRNLGRLLLKCFNDVKTAYSKGDDHWKQHELLVLNDKFRTFYTTNWDNALSIVSKSKYKTLLL